MAKVIVFGPTGNIGSVAARTAQEKGAKVFLAMRDTSKSIPGLSDEEEKSGGFERVQADLSKPDSVAEAVKKTGAKRAFMYLAFGSPDHMKSSIQAMKSAGIEFVVFLSSYTIHDQPLADFNPSQLIPYVHAQVELSLNEVYGEDTYVAVRPGGFATNLLRYKEDINEGEVRVYGGIFEQDGITPGDMGRVSGTILVDGPKNGQKKVYLYGPRKIPQNEAFKIIGKVLGKEIKITEIDEPEAREQFAQKGFPPPASNYMIKMLTDIKNGKTQDKARFEEGVKNVELYTGRPSTGLEEWVRSNKELFSV